MATTNICSRGGMSKTKPKKLQDDLFTHRDNSSTFLIQRIKISITTRTTFDLSGMCERVAIDGYYNDFLPPRNIKNNNCCLFIHCQMALKDCIYSVTNCLAVFMTNINCLVLVTSCV